MATDNKKYEIVQISDADWGIQYSDGSLTRGFQSRQEAIDNAIIISEKPNDTTGSQLNLTTPKDLNEALVLAQSARDNYREFVGSNPNATQEQKDRETAEIVRMDAFVSEYQAQQAQALQDSLNASQQDKQILDANEQLANAASQRDQAVNDAIIARQNIDTLGYTDEDIQEFDNKAFAAETYYESILQQQTQATELQSQSSVTGTSSLFSGGSSDYVNFGTSVISDSANALGNTVSNTSDTIRTTLGNDFGSISTSGLTSSSTTSGYGSTQYSGTTVYDTSVGVTAVASSSDQRVKLSPKPSQRSILSGVLEPLAETGGLVFPYTPTIQLQGNTNYNTLEPVQSNVDYQIYQNTPNMDITISGVFTAQNETEAKYLLACAHFLRVFTKMHFGVNDENAGLPPPQLMLDGYGTYMFNGLSVILRNYSMDLTDNVDYVTVNSANGTSKVPTLTTLNIMVTVQQTPSRAKQFNWDSFATGELMQQKGWI
jgi:hypothetical protein